jgi:hypothetical protein
MTAMALTRKDAGAAVVTALSVVVYLACAAAWPVPLVGASVRWATAAVLVLGVLGCTLGSPARDPASRVLGAIGTAAVVTAIVAVVTASEQALALLVATIVLLFIAATMRHSAGPAGRHSAAAR